ncbi:uncharacterized protein LOC131840654 [Achroia grisella]|uniref:uncharacterized protein LOC131840654 n=1 Tax=Achroia grisella TaxID=688607 RepID=UPI0027D21970|nr:uncharacterized protein LOC131840654 [Achroia grisella]
MAITGDVRITQNGGQENVKLHPYLISLVRWCVSRLWSTATVVLHRLMIRPQYRSLTALKSPRSPKRPRTAGTDHLHPEPKVDCVVLHQPVDHKFDVIFVHGLYGSLGNTWRQGDWRPKYKMEPDIVPLIDRNLTNCECQKINETGLYEGELNETNLYENELNDVTFNESFYDDIKIIPSDDVFITENFYNNTLLDQVEIVDNYEVQAEFVRDLFNKENINNCDQYEYNNETGLNEANICTFNEVYINENINGKYEAQNDINHNYNEIANEIHTNDSNCCKCDKTNEKRVNINVSDKYENMETDINESESCNCKTNESRRCDVGCGCVCDECYSTCWPKDWIKEDYPNARVISINYTSDPHLWRPLWVKESKRLRLHERAQQMTEQLLALNVGEKPIIWVGHSKGGLFIKQIYCEAYEAYLKTEKDLFKTNNSNDVEHNETEYLDMTKHNNDNEIYNIKDYKDNKEEKEITEETDKDYKTDSQITKLINDVTEQYSERSSVCNVTNVKERMCKRNENEQIRKDFDGVSESDFKIIDQERGRIYSVTSVNKHIIADVENANEDNEFVNNNIHIEVNVVDNELNNNVKCDTIDNIVSVDADKDVVRIDDQMRSSENEEDPESRIHSLWSNSVGFMFYSVPHRGSPLADFKMPITARSIELLEISKDCTLVLSLQERWLRATAPAKPAVRSLVETTRTLMSILWLRIVSIHSADAGIGGLYGVSVDHREICKPSSRHCMLYKELLNLMNTALNKCRCN